MENKKIQSEPALYVVATPIGNLGDLSPRAREVLTSVAFVCAESVAETKKLLAYIGSNAEIISFRESNRERMIPEIVERLKNGESCALVSDGGTPQISDPGSELVREVFLEKINVIPIPGPSAVSTILSVSPIKADKFIFTGFLPKKLSDVEKKLQEILKRGEAVIFFESPHRITEVLLKLDEIFPGELELFLGREMTKFYESFYHGTPKEVARALGTEVKGEICVVLKKVNENKTGAEIGDWKKASKKLVERGVKKRDVASAIGSAFDISTKEVYNFLTAQFKDNDDKEEK